MSAGKDNSQAGRPGGGGEASAGLQLGLCNRYLEGTSDSSFHWSLVR